VRDLASVPHRQGEDQATVPRIVLPITSRGLELTDRLCWGVLGVAMAASAALILYLNRGTGFNTDERFWVYSSPDLGVDGVLEPYNGNLIATTRLVYKAILETLGAGYLPFRVISVVAILLAAGLFYALAKRRVGPVVALAPTLVLLFFGSAGTYMVAPIGFTAVASIAAGLGALLALERDDTSGDVAACGLVVLSVATFGTGLAFLVGVAISVLLRPDRWRRAWIFVIPLGAYLAWALWAQGEPGSATDQGTASNILLIPNYIADSLAAAGAAIAGLDFDFERSAVQTTGGTADVIDLEWGRVVALVAVVALALRIRRGNVPHSLWVSLGVVLAFWTLGALVADSTLRPPGAVRYTYMGAVGVLLVATDAARSVRFSTIGLVAVFVACAVSLATNLALLRDAGAAFRTHSTEVRAQLATLELARDDVDPSLSPGPLSLHRAGAGAHLAAADRYGSFALPISDLTRQTESVREAADRMQAGVLQLGLRAPRRDDARGDCRVARGDGPGGPVVFELPLGGAELSARSARPATVVAGRFAAAPTAELDRLAPGQRRILEIPADASSIPWRASATGVRSIEVCGLR